jgi:hypothetical protein
MSLRSAPGVGMESTRRPNAMIAKTKDIGSCMIMCRRMDGLGGEGRLFAVWDRIRRLLSSNHSSGDVPMPLVITVFTSMQNGSHKISLTCCQEARMVFPIWTARMLLSISQADKLFPCILGLLAAFSYFPCFPQACEKQSAAFGKQK